MTKPKTALYNWQTWYSILIVIAMIAIFYWQFGGWLSKVYQSQSWPTTKATIINVQKTQVGAGKNIGCETHYTYSYAVDRQSYTCDQFNFSGDCDYSGWPGPYHVGDKVDIHYDPKQPEQAIIEVIKFGNACIFPGIFIVASLVLMIHGFIRSRIQTRLISSDNQIHWTQPWWKDRCGHAYNTELTLKTNPQTMLSYLESTAHEFNCHISRGVGTLINEEISVTSKNSAAKLTITINSSASNIVINATTICNMKQFAMVYLPLCFLLALLALTAQYNSIAGLAAFLIFLLMIPTFLWWILFVDSELVQLKNYFAVSVQRAINNRLT